MFAALRGGGSGHRGALQEGVAVMVPEFVTILIAPLVAFCAAVLAVVWRLKCC
jgi:hypothetical protein